MTFGVNTSPLSRPRGQVRDQPPDQGAPRPRGAGQRLDRGLPDRAPATRSRSAAAASCSWPCSSSRCAARASSCRSRGRRCCCARSTARSRSRTSGSRSTSRPTTSARSSQSLAGRKGRARADDDRRRRPGAAWSSSSRSAGLVGYRGQLLTETRGTALLHQIGEGYGPWAGEVTHRTTGVLVSDRTGTSNAYGLFNLQERAELFIGAGRRGLRGHDRRREQPLRRHGRQPDQGEEAHQHPDPLPRRGAAADAAAAADPRGGASSSSPRTSWSR